MSTAIEILATVLILIIATLWLTHAMNGTASEWIKSKFYVGGENA